MPRQPKKTEKPAKSPDSAQSRSGVTPLTAEVIAKRLKFKSARRATEWCDENGIPAFTRQEWQAAYGFDPGGSAAARFYHPGMVEALMEDLIIEQERAKEAAATRRRSGAGAPPPFDDDSDNF